MTSQKGIPNTVCVLFDYQKETRPLLSVRVNKHKVNALVDTGAQSTLVDARILTAVERDRIDKSIPINVIGLDGKTMPLLGAMEFDRAYVKVKLWQQEELVGRAKIVAKDTSKIIRFPATMNNSTIILQLYYRNYDVNSNHQQNLEQT